MRLVALAVHNGVSVTYFAGVRVESAAIAKMSPPKVGDTVWLVGLRSRLDATSSGELVSRETKIQGIEWQQLPSPMPPRYQQSNLEMIRLMDSIKTDGGVLSNEAGEIKALWASINTLLFKVF